VLVYAHRPEAERHAEYRNWLHDVVRAEHPYGINDLVLSGFVRIVTHPRIFRTPTPLPIALSFCRRLRGRANATIVAPGRHHWRIFEGLCRESGARGNLVPDAYLAALAIESGSEWITTDGDFRRFKGLAVRHPLDG
jgi:hypothetical protein